MFSIVELYQHNLSYVFNSYPEKLQIVNPAIIKPFCNETMRHEDNKWCTNVIANADLICIFGSLLGDTDRFWWE